MSWKKALGVVAGAAATTAAASLDPSLGKVVGASLGSGAIAKLAGKLVENRTGIALHKPLGPAAAAVGALGGAQFADPAALCEAVQRICANPAAIGLFVVGLHQLWSGLTSSPKRKP